MVYVSSHYIPRSKFLTPFYLLSAKKRFLKMDELLANLDDVVNTEEAIYDQAYISQSVSLYSQSSAPQDSQMSESRILPLFEMDNHEDVSVFLPELINGDFTTQ